MRLYSSHTTVRRSIVLWSIAVFFAASVAISAHASEHAVHEASQHGTCFYSSILDFANAPGELALTVWAAGYAYTEAAYQLQLCSTTISRARSPPSTRDLPA